MSADADQGIAGTDTATARPHVLFLPSFYSDPDKPIVGVFFKDQAKAVAAAGAKVGLAFVEPRGLRNIGPAALAQSHWQISFDIEEGLPTVRMHAWNSHLASTPGGLAWVWLTRRLMRRYIAAFGRPDLIHAHNAVWAGVAASRIRCEHQIPYVVTEHSTRYTGEVVPQPEAKWAAEGYRGASTVIAVSRALAGAIAPYAGKPIVMPNCVDTDYFSPAGNTVRAGGFRFLAVAHLFARKGFDILLRAFATAFPGGAETLAIGGAGPMMSELVALAHKLGLAGRVSFLGGLDRNAVRAAMREADAFVLPSSRETFGVVLLEAMSVGLAIVATRSGGPEEFVTPEVGVLVPPGDVGALAAALREVRASRRYHSDEIRSFVRSRYDYAVVAKRLIEIYRQTIEREQASADADRLERACDLRGA
jgi:glycosyltransferase involved in cell wall biosynthesis